MKVLVGCEESQTVCIAFRERGHEAYSCDIQECSGGHPEWHIQYDVLRIVQCWDLIIAFPPCTHLAASGARFWNEKKKDGRQLDAIHFVKKLWFMPCNKICIENPVGILSTAWRKPNQIIQPYQFGGKYTKKTCLWLKNLPPLKPTKIVEPEYVIYNSKKNKSGKSKYSFMGQLPSTNNPNNARLRSKTFIGIAQAMAEQWSENLINNATQH